MALLAALVVMVNLGFIYAEITCEAPAIRIGDPAYIICLFDVDVNVAKKNIKVQRRSLTSVRFDPDKTDTVLDCYWQNAADFSCQFGNGFKLVGEVGRTAVVRIASASKNDEQVYMCEVVPSDPTNIQTCTLTVRDPPACDGNCSNINVVPKQLEDDTAEVKGIVTAIIIIIIVISVLVVLLVCFKKPLKNHLQRCYTRCRSPQEGERDPEAAGMLSHSNDPAGDEGKAKENAKEKKKIDRYIRLLKTMKHNGELDEFYKVSHTDEKETTESDLATGIASLHDGRHTHSDRTEVQSEEGAGRGAKASKPTVIPTSSELPKLIEYKLPTDPEGLQITVKEWCARKKAEIGRKTEEFEAEKVLYQVKENHAKWRHERKEKDRIKGKTDLNEDPQRRKKREKQEKERWKEEDDAVTNLAAIRSRHDLERKRQEEHDKQRLEHAKELKPTSESAGGGYEDTVI